VCAATCFTSQQLTSLTTSPVGSPTVRRVLPAVVVVVVLVLGSHGVVNQVDRRYLTFCHRHSPPSFKDDGEVGEDRLRLS